MIIDLIRISLIRLPFRVAYGHKQKTHKDVFAIICQINDGKECYGLGESIPRTYVTGETALSVFKDANTLGKQLLGKKVSSYADVKKTILDIANNWPSPFPSGKAVQKPFMWPMMASGPVIGGGPSAWA